MTLMTSDLEVLSNDVVADVEELEFLGEHVDGDSRRPAKSSAALVEVEDRVETRTMAVEEVLVALAVVEAGAAQPQYNKTSNDGDDDDDDDRKALTRGTMNSDL